MMLHAKLCTMSKYIQSPAVSRLCLHSHGDAPIVSISTCIHSPLVTVHCVLHCTETDSYALAPFTRAASSSPCIFPRRRGLYTEGPLSSSTPSRYVSETT
jgi:hypothetical protein